MEISFRFHNHGWFLPDLIFTLMIRCRLFHDKYQEKSDNYSVVNVHFRDGSVYPGPLFYYDIVLLNWQAFHKPAVLLFRYVFSFLLCPRPSVSSSGQPFITQQPAVTFVEEDFDTVAFVSAEKKYTARFSRILSETVNHSIDQTIYSAPHVCVPCAKINMGETSSII